MPLLIFAAIGLALSILVVVADLWDRKRADERRQRALDSLRWPE